MGVCVRDTRTQSYGLAVGTGCIAALLGQLVNRPLSIWSQQNLKDFLIVYDLWWQC